MIVQRDQLDAFLRIKMLTLILSISALGSLNAHHPSFGRCRKIQIRFSVVFEKTYLVMTCRDIQGGANSYNCTRNQMTNYY